MFNKKNPKNYTKQVRYWIPLLFKEFKDSSFSQIQIIHLNRPIKKCQMTATCLFSLF